MGRGVGVGLGVDVGLGVAEGSGVGGRVRIGYRMRVGLRVGVGAGVPVAEGCGVELGVVSAEPDVSPAGGRVGEAGGGTASDPEGASSTNIMGGPPSTHPWEQSAPPSWTT